MHDVNVVSENKKNVMFSSDILEFMNAYAFCHTDNDIRFTYQEFNSYKNTHGYEYFVPIIRIWEGLLRILHSWA